MRDAQERPGRARRSRSEGKMERIAMKPSHVALAALMLVSAGPAAAQNGSAEPPDVSSPPTQKSEPPATTSSTTTVPVTVQPAQPVVVQPVPAPAPPPPAPVTIQPDAAYPNGFADPADPFANDVALSYSQRQGFPWGLLGLLGLLGLIPLVRGNGRVRTVYVEREDGEPRRVVRRERIDEE
jgi:hypothetical protein